MKERRGEPRLIASGVALGIAGFVFGTVPVPWLVPVSRLLGNLVVVLGSLLVLAGWALAGAGLARPSRRWLGGALGVASYFVVGAVWTTVFVLVDPWTVDYGRVDLVRFVLYSVVLWPYALAYAAGWFGLAGL